MAKSAKRTKAIAYLRTASAANVGADKYSDKRQADAIAAFANRSRFEVVETYYGFSALLDKIEGNGVRTVIVEDASRFARDLMVQELGILLLIKRDVTVYACNGENLTETDDPMKRAMRQIAGVFAELEKHRLVSKLKSARDRKRPTGVKVEGRKALAETNPDAVKLAKRLRRASPKTGERMGLRKISSALADAGHLNERGQPFNAKSIQAMVDGPRPKEIVQ